MMKGKFSASRKLFIVVCVVFSLGIFGGVERSPDLDLGKIAQSVILMLAAFVGITGFDLRVRYEANEFKEWLRDKMMAG